MIVALTLGWCVDRQRLAVRAEEAESYEALSKVLARQLQDKYPASNIQVSINGHRVITAVEHGDTSEIVIEVKKKRPNSSAYAPNPPKA
jgi:hypothetical protein